MKKNNSSSSAGMGITGVLQIIFIVLKLVGAINWSWWVVLIPLWIDLGMSFILVLIVFIISKSMR